MRSTSSAQVLDFGLKRKKQYPNHNPRSALTLVSCLAKITTEIQKIDND
jgi:hypothetical protein